MQRRLAVSQPDLAAYDREREILTTLINSKSTGDAFHNRAYRVSPSLFMSETSASLGSIAIRVERPEVDEIWLNVELFDSQGGFLERWISSVSLRADRSSWPGYPERFAMPLAMTPRIREIRRIAWQDGSESEALTPVARDPVRNEPGEIFARPILDALREASGQEAIVGLPDEAIPPLAASLAKEEPAKVYAERLETSVRLRTAGGLVVGCPRFPVETTKMRLDRALLRDLLGRIGRKRGYPIDTVADYCTKQTMAAGATRLEPLVMVAAGAGGPMNPLLQLLHEYAGGGREVLRLYGSLPLAARKALWEGNAVPLISLPPTVQSSLAGWVYRHKIHFPPVLRNGGLILADAPASLPNGIPAQTYLQAETEFAPAVITARPPLGAVPMTMDGFAFTLLAQETKNPRFWSPSLPDLRTELLMPLRRSSLVLKVHFSPKVAIQTVLTGYDPTASTAVPYLQLPEEHRALAEETLRVLRKAEETRRNGQSGGAKPPPQP